MQNLVRLTLVAMATTFALGAESNRLPACMSVCIDSAPARSLLFFGVDSVCLSVCNAPSILQIDSSSLFLDRIEPFLGHQFSMTKATKRCTSNFDLLSWQRNLGYFCKNFKLLLLFCFPMEASHFLAVSFP